MFQAEISSFALRLAAEGKAAKTIRTYTEAVQWFAAALPEQASRASWEQVTSRDIQRWMAWLLDRLDQGGSAALRRARPRSHRAAALGGRPGTAGRAASEHPQIGSAYRQH